MTTLNAIDTQRVTEFWYKIGLTLGALSSNDIYTYLQSLGCPTATIDQAAEALKEIGRYAYKPPLPPQTHAPEEYEKIFQENAGDILA